MANPSPFSVGRMEAILAEIETNQEAFEAAGRSWKRLIPFWLLRTEYALVKANEPLFEALGCPSREPLNVETESGWDWALVRMFTGARRA